MNNLIASDLINECLSEFERIERVIDVLTNTNPAVPFLTKYAIVKACGTIEQCFKTIIYDFTCLDQSPHVKNYIKTSFKASSLNPSLENIHSSLKKFNNDWNENFKESLKNDPNISKIRDSLNSLNNARNQFAHGINPSMSFHDLKEYFDDSLTVINYLDELLQ